MPDNPTYIGGDESEGKYGTFDCDEKREEKEEIQDQKDIVIEIPPSHQESGDDKGSSRSWRLQKISKSLSFTAVKPPVKLRESELCTRFFGLFLAFISGVMMTTYSSMIKMLDEMDTMQVVVIRGVLQFSIMGSIALYKRLSFRGTTDKKIGLYLFVLAFTGGLRILFIFTSFARLPLGDSTTILFSSPVLVMVLSVFILKEKCGVFRVVAAVTLVSGVVLIAKPPFIFGQEEKTTYDALGYSLVLSACVMSAMGIVLTKLTSKHVEKLIILFYLGLATTTCGTVGLFSLGRPSLPPLRDWMIGITIGLLGLAQQYVLVWAIQLESAARVAVVRQMQIVLAYAVQIIMFGVMPTWSDLLGAGLVFGIVVTIPFENIITSRLCSAEEKEDKAEKVKKESK